MHSVVKTTAGEVRGEVTDGVARYLGIPYAAAPFGEHRLRAPAPLASWDGVRDALEHGPTAPAPGYPALFSELLPEIHIPGAEILNLSVWTPGDGAVSRLRGRDHVGAAVSRLRGRDHVGAARPVMVWIHGGAFVNGSSSLPTYDGSAFARDGVVLVGVNYRLGVEGFLHLPDAVPNRGLLDQVAALQWVRDNIAAFGGDPGNVTVFGESAGAMSVGALLAMPAARGLFRRAVLQSGAGHHALSVATATRVAGYAAEILGVPATREAMAGFAPERLVEVQKALSADSASRPDPGRWGEIAANAMVFEPVVDGEVLPRLPIEAVAAGSAAGVEIMVGANRDEHRLFLVPPGFVEAATEPMLAAFAAGYRLPDGALESYRALRPDASPGQVLADVATDWFFRIPALRLAEAHAGTHVYEFDWATPALEGRLGACHGLELGFVFDTLATVGGMAGSAPPQALADAMHRAWVAFATTGDPGWEPYGEQRHVRRFANAPATVRDPRGETRELWAGVR